MPQCLIDLTLRIKNNPNTCAVHVYGLFWMEAVPREHDMLALDLNGPVVEVMGVRWNVWGLAANSGLEDIGVVLDCLSKPEELRTENEIEMYIAAGLGPEFSLEKPLLPDVEG